MYIILGLIDYIASTASNIDFFTFMLDPQVTAFGERDTFRSIENLNSLT